MMRLVLCCLILLSSFCIVDNKIFAQDNSLSKYKSVFDNELKDWTNSFKDFNLQSFSLSNIRDFNSPDTLTTEDSAWKDFIYLYKPILSFSKDNRRIIDLYSYDLSLEKRNDSVFENVAGEQTIYFYDLNDNTETKLFFLGISSMAQEVVWFSNDTFIIVAHTKIEREKDNLTIYVGNCKQRKLYNYSSDDSTCCKELHHYSSPKFDKIKIYD